MKIAGFWVVAPCGPVEVYRRFRGACYVQHQSHACGFHIALTMEAASTTETLVNFYRTTRRYNPEDGHFHLSFYILLQSLFMISFPSHSALHSFSHLTRTFK
jgi:hypothetical protein